MVIDPLIIKSNKLANLHNLCFEQTPPPYSAASFYEFLKDVNCHLFEKGRKGFAIAKLCDEVADIVTIAVDPNFQRSGVGEQLLRKLINKLTLLGANQFFLEVADNNLPAINLYRKLNFKPIYKRKNYFSNNDKKLDATVFKRVLNTC